MLSRLLPEKANPKVRAEQVRLLYLQGSTIQLLGVATALVSVAMLWPVADHNLLLTWLVVMLAVSSLRLAMWFRFTKIEVPDESMDNWAHAYIAGAFVSGVIWGMLAFLHDPSWPVAYQVFLFVLYTGLIAGAFNTHSSVFLAFPAFYIPAVACLMIVMLQQKEAGFIALGALFAIYILLMYVSSLKYHKHLAHALELRFDNEQLAEKLALSNQELIRLADMDELTAIFNRRSMNRYLDSEWKRHHRSQEPISLLYIDIDLFKQYNDTYGHKMGDECLVQIASLLKEGARRATDMAARFGGEEFAIILPETEQAEAVRIANRLQSGLEALRIEHRTSTVSDHVTMSIGVATMIPHQAEEGDEKIREAADRALYKAKQDGRNRIICAYGPKGQITAQC